LKILLTGATGFIGSQFARLAISQGHEVTALVRPGKTFPPDSKVKPLAGELVNISVKEIAAAGPEVCVHTAWITTPGVYLESPENFKFRDDSLQFLRRVAEAGAKHIVGLGTCIEYQISGQPLSEDRTPIAPATTYAKCKNELRLALEAEAKRGGFNFAWGRVFYPYGPGEHPSRLFSSIITKLGRGEKMILKTPQSTKDYIFIDDLAAALLTVVEKKFSGAINLGTGSGTAVRDIAHTIGKLMSREELVSEANPPERDPLGDVIADATKLKSLGWQKKMSLEQGIQGLLAIKSQNLPN
jgi:nucleoside-diphosphate-sugar epimerase